MRKFGVPYQGSKSRIAQKLIDVLPKGNRFVDLFAGGCAMTHAALLSGKYNAVLANDLYPHGLNVFRNALAGEYSKPEYLRWVSRDEFFRLKDTDDFIRLVYSFGNNQKDYLFGRKTEPLKRALHCAVVYDDWRYFDMAGVAVEIVEELKTALDGKTGVYNRLAAARCVAHKYKLAKTSVLQEVEALRRLESIERITALQAIAGGVCALEATSEDYTRYQHEDGDVVYCDPPYYETKSYNGRQFDNAAFWDWVRRQPFPVYVSEYNAPDDFAPVFSCACQKLMNGGTSCQNKAVEKLFLHSRWKQPENKTVSTM